MAITNSVPKSKVQRKNVKQEERKHGPLPKLEVESDAKEQ